MPLNQLLSLLFFSSLSLFPSLYPLRLRNNHPTAAADKKILMGNSCSPSLSPLLPSPSLTLSMPLYLLFLFLLVSSLPTPPPTPTLALYPPYASLSFLSLSRSSPLFLFFPPPPPLNRPYFHPINL